MYLKSLESPSYSAPSAGGGGAADEAGAARQLQLRQQLFEHPLDEVSAVELSQLERLELQQLRQLAIYEQELHWQWHSISIQLIELMILESCSTLVKS